MRIVGLCAWVCIYCMNDPSPLVTLFTITFANKNNYLVQTMRNSDKFFRFHIFNFILLRAHCTTTHTCIHSTCDAAGYIWIVNIVVVLIFFFQINLYFHLFCSSFHCLRHCQLCCVCFGHGAQHGVYATFNLILCHCAHTQTHTANNRMHITNLHSIVFKFFLAFYVYFYFYFFVFYAFEVAFQSLSTTVTVETAGRAVGKIACQTHI